MPVLLIQYVNLHYIVCNKITGHSYTIIIIVVDLYAYVGVFLFTEYCRTDDVSG
jgi:hypothetical protein